MAEMISCCCSGRRICDCPTAKFLFLCSRFTTWCALGEILQIAAMKARCGTRSRAYRPARSRSSMQEVFQDVSGLTGATSQKSAACPGQGSSPRSGPSGERIGQGPRKQRGPSDLRIRIAPLMAHQLTRIPTSRPTRHCHEVSLPRASNPRPSSTGLPQKGLKPDFSKLRHAHTAQPGLHGAESVATSTSKHPV